MLKTSGGKRHRESEHTNAVPCAAITNGHHNVWDQHKCAHHPASWNVSKKALD